MNAPEPNAASPSATVLLATGVTVLAALAGGWLMSVVSSFTGLYIPFIPGAVVGYAVARWCRSNHLAVALIAACGGFAGMVFGDALTFDMVDFPGTWNYLTHFWKAASVLKVIFWIANAAIAFLSARVEPAVARGEPVRPATARSCPACGAANPTPGSYCSGCGRRLPAS